MLDANNKRYGDGSIPVIAPEHFLEEAALENAIVGDAMARRSTYQYGTFLPVQNDGSGKVDAGLGKDIQQGGTVGFAAPTCEVLPGGAQLNWEQDYHSTFVYEAAPVKIDGVDFEFLLCPGTEAPSEMTIWVGQYHTLVAAEVATHTLHNLLTPRGAEVRDARKWWKALDKLSLRYGGEMERICATHHWPMWERDRCGAFLEEQRDSYKFLHDQTVRLINKGNTMLEIAERFDDPANLPDLLRSHWHNRGYYGTVSHDVRAIYQKYLGWYDMNPANLNPLPPVAAARRYVEAMGGEHAVRERIKAILDNQEGSGPEDYRWAAELGKHMVFAYPESASNREVLADLYGRLARPCEAGTWRNMYLVAERELRENRQISYFEASTVSVPILSAMDAELLLDFIASRFAAEESAGAFRSFDLLFQGEDRRFGLDTANRVFRYREKPIDEASESFTCTVCDREAFSGVLLGRVTLSEALEAGAVSIPDDDGTGENIRQVQALLNLIDNASPNFNIATP